MGFEPTGLLLRGHGLANRSVNRSGTLPYYPSKDTSLFPYLFRILRIFPHAGHRFYLETPHSISISMVYLLLLILFCLNCAHQFEFVNHPLTPCIVYQFEHFLVCRHKTYKKLFYRFGPRPTSLGLAGTLPQIIFIQINTFFYF